MCEISELTADVVHATAVKHIADDDDGDGDIDDDGDSDAGVGETRLTSCNFFLFCDLVIMTRKENKGLK